MVLRNDKKGLYGTFIGIGIILALLIVLFYVFFSKATPLISFFQEWWWVIAIAFGVYLFRKEVALILRRIIR